VQETIRDYTAETAKLLALYANVDRQEDARQKGR
jgi:hypothetical protein